MLRMFRHRLSSLRKSKSTQQPESEAFLNRCTGVLHVGANEGQERHTYAKLGLPVVWVEALPGAFDQLRKNIAPYSNQIAIQALLTDCDGKTYVFRVANNAGASSSILEMKHHKDIWPDVKYIDQIEMVSTTLKTMLASHALDVSKFNALVMDTQGSEQLILEGAGELVAGFDFIKTEAADFESYENCATVESLKRYLQPFGFEITRMDAFAQHPELGNYYDILFEKRTAVQSPQHDLPSM